MNEAAATRNVRYLIAVVTGVVIFLFSSLLFVSVGRPNEVRSLIFAFVIAAFAAFWIAKGTTSVRSAGGVGCLFNGFLSGILGSSILVQDDLLSGHSQYMADLERAAGSVAHFALVLGAWVGIAALGLGAVLFTLSWLLLKPRHGHT